MTHIFLFSDYCASSCFSSWNALIPNLRCVCKMPCIPVHVCVCVCTCSIWVCAWAFVECVCAHVCATHRSYCKHLSFRDGTRLWTKRERVTVLKASVDVAWNKIGRNQRNQRRLCEEWNGNVFWTKEWIKIPGRERCTRGSPQPGPQS